MRKNTLAAMKSNWLSFINDKDNKPYLDKTYGTKYPGNVLFEHYILWALLRGKDPALCSHDPSSEKYLEALEKVNSVLAKKQTTSGLLFVFLGDNVTEESLDKLMN